MKTIHRGLLTLIKSAITDEKLPLPQGFTLEEAGDLIIRHSMGPMVYLGGLNCGLAPKSKLMQQCQVEYFRQMVRGDKQLQAIDRICGAFEENGIDYMPLKGSNLKKLYPRQELRVMGDADILIRLEQYERIKPIMRQLQYEEVKESPYDFCWQTKELYVELHKRLFAPTQADLCGYFGDGWDKAVKSETHRYNMSREDEYVYIFCHMAKHFRFCGIGARQLVDLYVYRRTYPDLNEADIEAAMDSLGLLEFYRNIRRMIAVWFEDAPADPVTDLITEYVFSNGNWGSDQNKLYAEELMKAKRKGKLSNSKGSSFIRALFPPLDRMQMSYNILYKWPVLYPIYWVVRWVDILLHRRKKISEKLNIIQNMTDEKVEAHRQALDMMGLSFDFCEEDEED